VNEEALLQSITNIFTNKSTIQTMMLMMMMLMFQNESDQNICVVYMATLFITSFPSKPPGDGTNFNEGKK